MQYAGSILLSLICSLAYAQTASIKGSVVDASTNEPLPFGNVFINNSTIGTTSDLEGNFEIRNIPVPGIYEVVVSHIGYGSYAQKVDLTQSVMLRVVKLKPSEIVLSDVEVKASRDKEWEKKMKRFSKVFLGSGAEAKHCTILNPWVVDFHPNKDPNILVASASQPIIIENNALGYKVEFLLSNFSTSLTDYSINGKAFFEEIEPKSDQQRDKWREERERAYRNSKQHLFKSIIEERIAGEGFLLFSEIPGARNTRSNFFYKEELGGAVVYCDTTKLLSEGPQDGTYTILIPRRLEIHNMNYKDNSSIYRDVLHPVSWVQSKSGRIVVNKDGFEMSGSDAVTLGAISNIRVSLLIPTNYRPVNNSVALPQSADFGFLQEKIYVHCDKPYYYPGETIWFKGYIKYRALSLKDSLSSTVYAELIGPDKKIAFSKMLAITGGSFHNEFTLPDTLPAGDYHVRCYTTLNRNFGDHRLYTKYIPVLDVKQTVDVARNDIATESNDLVRITPSKEKYLIGEQIEITLSADNNVQAADLSMSVTDVQQVVPVRSGNTIVEELEEDDTIKVVTLVHPVEYGFGFDAHYDHEGSKDKALNVFQIEPRFYTMAQPDEKGNFSVGGLGFYDSAYFAVMPSGKNKAIGTTTIFPREIPPVHLPSTRSQITVIQGDTPRLLHYKTNEVTILKEVTVEATRISRVKSKNAVPDQVMTGDQVRASHPTNLFLALMGKFNRLRFRQTVDIDDQLRWFVYLINKNTRGNGIISEVAVTINDSRVYGDAESVLVGINMSTVVSVELIVNDHFLYGNRATNGVLAIYTSTDEWKDAEIDRSKNVLVYGYTRPSVFNTPGSTIFWAPRLTLNEKVAFKAGEFPGEYKIVVEGISTNGTPIRAEKTITIE